MDKPLVLETTYYGIYVTKDIDGSWYIQDDMGNDDYIGPTMPTPQQVTDFKNAPVHHPVMELTQC